MDNMGKIGGVRGKGNLLENRWTRWTFILSCTALVVLIPAGNVSLKAQVIGLIAAFLAAALLTCRFSFLNKVFESVVRWQITLASVFALVAAFNFYNGFCWAFHYGVKLGVLPQKFETFSVLVYVIAGCMATAAVPAAFVFLYAFISRFVPIIQDGIKESDLVEKSYFVIGGLLLTVLLIVFYNMTTVFCGVSVGPRSDVEKTGFMNSSLLEMQYCYLADRDLIVKQNYWITIYAGTNDCLYLADSGLLCVQNCWMNINAGQNDLRQMLFGVYAMPFAIAALLLSYVFFFIPNSYLICLGIVQVGLVLTSALLIGRMLHLNFCKFNNPL